MSADRMPERVFVAKDGYGKCSVHSNAAAALSRAQQIGQFIHSINDCIAQEYVRADLHEALLSTIESQGKEIERLRGFIHGAISLLKGPRDPNAGIEAMAVASWLTLAEHEVAETPQEKGEKP